MTLPHSVRGGLGFAADLLLTLLGLAMLVFVISRLLPADPVLAVVGDRAPQDVYDAAQARLGLDLPLWQQFARYLGALCRGDLGTSLLSGQPVLRDLARAFPATVELATLATAVAVLAGIPLGVLAAVRRGSPVDHGVRLLALAGHSVPVFWLGLAGLLVFYLRLGWVAGPGRIDIAFQYVIEPRTGMMLVDTVLAGDGAAFRDAVSHAVLPAGILGLYSMAYVARMARSLVLEQLGAEYVVTARVKGASEAAIIVRHVLRNMAAPLATVALYAYANVLSGSVVTETVFAWPGIGLYVTQSLLGADLNAMLGGTILIGACYVILNAASEPLLRLLDPRLRRG